MRFRPGSPGKGHSLRRAGLVLAAWAAVAGPATLLTPQIGGTDRALAETVVFSEDFTSTALRDSLFTTAWWDTLAGELRLYPQPLVPRGVWNTAGNAYACALTGSHLMVADGSGGLASIDVADPDLLLLSDTFATADQARDLVLVGGNALVAVGGAGLQILDVSDPSDLKSRSLLDTAGYATGVAVLGTWVYLAQSNLGVAVVQAADPDNPLPVGDVPTLDWARGLAVHGGHLLVADGDAGLTILDLTDPAAPVQVANLNTAGTVLDVAAEGNLAYLAAGAAGLIIADVSDPAAPVQIGSLTLVGTCRHVAAAGDTVYVAGGAGGLYLVDVSDPASPVAVARRDTEGEAYHTAVGAALAWLCDGLAGVKGFSADPQGLDPARHQARSRNLNQGGEAVQRALLAADLADSLRFEVSVDGGGSWAAITPGGDWVEFPIPGADLRWRAFLVQTGPYPGPVCRSLTLTWDRLHNYPTIAGLADIPQDTGGQVRLTWQASRYDAPDLQHKVTEYSVYRRYALPAKVYPPGDWDYLLTVPADMEQEYSAVVPTLADSAAAGIAWSVFFVRARTATLGVYFDSPVDSGYSVDNLRPAPPTGFHAAGAPLGGTVLTWDASPDPQFANFALYRSAVPVSLPLPADLLQVTTQASFLDGEPGTWHYLLTVVDLGGRQSEPAFPTVVSAVPASAALVLRTAPNPFNPATVLSFQVPDPGAVAALDVFDARGRLVTNLWHGALAAGPHQFVWRGLDRRGVPCAGGTYTCRLVCGGITRTVKVSLIR